MLRKRRKLRSGGHAMKTARLDAHGMDFPAAEHAHDFVAGLFDRQAVLDHGAMVARHLDPIGEAQEVRRVQHNHVQAVAFKPFAAIDQAPQRTELAANLRPEGVLDGVDGAHLIRDRANAANTRHDVSHFGVAPAAYERLEKARRLENLQLRRGNAPIADLQVERALAFDAGEIFDHD